MPPLLQVSDLSVHIGKGRRELVAVEDVSFSLESGRALGIVGESGCGKSVACLALTRLASDNIRIARGEVLFEGISLTSMGRRGFDRLRGKAFSMIFQDSISGLNPLVKAGRQVSEALCPSGKGGRRLRDRTLELLSRVRLDQPDIIYGKYPHQLSGGQRQRVMIAMAIASNPRLLVADEPTTALDLTTQLQILALLRDLQAENGMGMILVSHDVAVIQAMCQDVLVIYSGQVVESGGARQVLQEPKHPYTRALIRSAFCARHKGSPLEAIQGVVAPLEQRQDIVGCRFAARCGTRCAHSGRAVPMRLLPDGRAVRCHLEGGMSDA